jgi:hypothetical protein
LRDFRARGFPALPAVPASLLDGKEGVSGSSPEDQVVCETDEPGGVHGDASADQLTRRPLGARFVPVAELRRVRGRKRACGDREECDQPRGIRAHATEARGHEPIRHFRPRGAFGQEAALAAAGIAEDDAGGDLTAEYCISGLSERCQLVDPTDERVHGRSVRRNVAEENRAP